MISDPDNDAYTVKIQLGILSKFAKASGSAFIDFSPGLNDIG